MLCNPENHLTKLQKKLFEGFITAKSVTDIYYLTHRYTHSDKETRKILSNIFVLLEPLATDGLNCRKAISSEISDYEDAVMVETAIRCEIDCTVLANEYVRVCPLAFSF